MTGEKIRTMRKDHNKTNKNDEILDTYDETSNGSSNNFTSNKAFQKSSALQQLNANNINGNPSSIDTIVSDNNKNPIILTSNVFDFPVHECVFKGDVRRLSSLIRTHSISQKDVHGNPLSLGPYAVGVFTTHSFDRGGRVKGAGAHQHAFSPLFVLQETLLFI